MTATDPTTLVVLGAGGRIGRAVVAQALAAGHRVTAVVRRPEAVPATHANLVVVIGDVLDREVLDGALDGADAVVFAVGSRGRGPSVVRSTGTAAVTKAMRDHGVARLLVVSPSTVAISPKASLLRKIALRFFIHKLERNPLNDVERMEDELRYTTLDWSVVRASTLHDGPATHDHRVVPDGQLRRERRLSTADLAQFVVRHATDQGASRDVVTVTGPA